MQFQISCRHDLDSPNGLEIVSNPTAIHNANNVTMVFCLCIDGQVYYVQQDQQKPTTFGKWRNIPSSLPAVEGREWLCQNPENVG